MIRRAAPALLAAAMVLGACGEEARRLPPTPKAIVRWPLPEFTYTDQSGQPFGLDDLRGKVWIATFFFVRCTGPCPAMTAAMAKLQEESADLPDLHLVSFTVDPESEDVALLRDYAGSWKADPTKWRFLRGPDNPSVARLQEASFKAGGADHHTPLFFLVDGDSAVRRFWDARDPTERALLLADARRLLAGRPLDPIPTADG